MRRSMHRPDRSHRSSQLRRSAVAWTKAVGRRIPRADLDSRSRASRHVQASVAVPRAAKRTCATKEQEREAVSLRKRGRNEPGVVPILASYSEPTHRSPARSRSEPERGSYAMKNIQLGQSAFSQTPQIQQLQQQQQHQQAQQLDAGQQQQVQARQQQAQQDWARGISQQRAAATRQWQQG